MSGVPEPDSLAGIALVGISGRFPGAPDVDRFWRNLLDGVEAITPLTDEDLAQSGIDPALARHPKYVKAGRVLDDVDLFDASFFGFSRREAEVIDPQHRFFLECAWEALEDAGYNAGAFDGQVGVYAGSTVSTYQAPADHSAHAADALETLQVLLGNDKDYLATQLSYRLNLTGPSIGVQTACSTSLTAVCLASQALLTYQCDLALAGGVTIRLPQKTGYLYQEGGLFSPDGRCRTYDASAGGVVFGSGVGVVALKRLEDAVRNRDRIYAVIRGWALNNDGSKKVGFTAPGAEGQVQALTLAYSMADVDPGSIGYLEGHGTATPLGDAIEISALKRVFRAHTDAKGFCALGSVKANVGHLDAAAGVAGLIKASLALHHRVLPPSPNFEKPHPDFDLENSAFFVNREPLTWAQNGQPRRAGVSSFGIGGTNAHVVLEEAPEPQAVRRVERSEYLLPLSARTPEALRALAGAWREWTRAADCEPLDDLAWCAGARRTHHEHRLALVARSSGEAADLIESWLNNETNPNLHQGSRPSDRRRRTVFVFPGQGGQWFGMGRELAAAEPVFRQTMEKCAAALRRYMAGGPLLPGLLNGERTARFEDIDFIQPAIFAMQVSLAALWSSWGVRPDAVIGHSMGEIAAAHVAGALTLDDAARIIARRSWLARRIAGRGAMAMVELSMADCRQALRGVEDRVSVAAANSPRGTVLSGDREALEALLAKFDSQGVFCRFVKVDIASHSSQVDPILSDLRRELAAVQPKAAAVPVYSTVLGHPIDGTPMTAEYWVRNFREPVLFAPSIERMAGEEFDTFVELSPHPVLLPSIEEAAGSAAVFASTRREQPERIAMLQTLSGLYARGLSVDWNGLYPEGGRHVSLPRYPWQRERFWMKRVEHPSFAAESASRHPMLARAWRSSLQPQLHQWDADLSSPAFAYIREHRVDGAAVLPAAASVEGALAAAREVFGASASLEDVELEQALVFQETEEAKLQWSVVQNGAAGGSFHLSHNGGGAWTRLVSGRVRADATEAASRVEIEELRRACPESVSREEHYSAARSIGIDYGPAFQGIERIWRGKGQALARIRWTEQPPGSYAIHPAILDACFQVLAHAAGSDGGSGAAIPVRLKRFWFGALPESGLYVHAVRSAADGRSGMTGDLNLLDEDGALVGQAAGFEIRAFSGTQTGQENIESWLYEVKWEPQSRPAAATRTPGAWLIVSPDGDRAAIERLRASGEECAVVRDAGELAGSPMPPYRGIVYLPARDAQGPDSALECSAAVLQLVQIIAQTPWRDFPRLWIATREARAVASGDPVTGIGSASLWGLGRTIAMEHPELHCTLVDLDEAAEASGELAEELLNATPETAIAFRNGQRYAARLERWSAPAPAPRPAGDREFRVEVDTPGILDSVVLREMRPAPPARGEVQIRVRATGLNFADLLILMGAYESPETTRAGLQLGGECSGVVTAVGPDVRDFQPGDEVLAMRMGSLATMVNVPRQLVWRKPAGLSFEQAAALPVAFGTAYYALTDVARLSAEESVLIHLASGGVGLSAVQIARRAGARIFATAGTPHKRAFLKSLGVEHVLDSRSLDFADEILRRTDGRGVDVVLNSLSGEAIPRSLSVLAQYGRFVEIGKRDIYDNNLIGLGPFRKGLSYTAVDLKAIAADRPAIVGRVMEDILAGMTEGSFQPLPAAIVRAAGAADAFRKFGQEDHIGKIVVSMDGAAAMPIVPSETAAFRPDAAYVVTGGLGGLGLALVSWMVDAGARNLALFGRSAPGPEAQAVLDRARVSGARIETFQGDVSRAEDVSRLFEALDAGWPPVRGIVHAAGVLEDGILLHQDADRFRQVLDPKVRGAWNLHSAAANRPLDFFVMFSSTSAVLGSPGQGNHAAANACLDALAQFRRAQGLPALSINWGPWADIGKAAGLRGAASIPPARGLEILGRLLASSSAQAAVIPFSLRQWREFYPAASGSELVERWTGAAASSSGAPFVRELMSAPAVERLDRLASHLAEQIGKVLRTAPQNVNRNAPLNTQGLDSLMALELRNRLESSLGLTLRATLIWSYPTVTALAAHLAELLGLDIPEEEPAEPAAPEVPDDVAQLSEEEATAELLARLAAYQDLPQ